MEAPNSLASLMDMAALGARERIGVLSAGLGGLPALRECMLIRPDAEFIVLSDGALLTSHAYNYQRVATRVQKALDELRSMGASRVIAPGIPTGTASSSELPKAFAEFSESLLHLELCRAADLTQAGRIAVVLTPTLADSWPYLDLGSRAGELSVAMCVSATLGPVLDRTIERDAISVAVVEEVADAVRETDADVVIFACQHAHLAEDLFRRALGRSIRAVESPRLTASLLEGPELAAPSSGTPRVSVVSASGDTKIVDDANRYLQAPITGIDRVELPELSADLPMEDRISLAYAAFDRGDVVGARALFTRDATVHSEILGQLCPSALTDALTACRRRFDTCVSILEAFMSSGEFVGVTGWHIATDPGTAEPRHERFSHLFKCRGEFVQELRLVHPRPPWDPDISVSSAQ